MDKQEQNKGQEGIIIKTQNQKECLDRYREKETRVRKNKCIEIEEADIKCDADCSLTRKNMTRKKSQNKTVKRELFQVSLQELFLKRFTLLKPFFAKNASFSCTTLSQI